MATKPKITFSTNPNPRNRALIEGLIPIEVMGLAHGAGKKARIEEMQYGMFDAADILVDRHPIARRTGFHRHVGVGRAKARVVP